jgi:hypothetical protein
MSDDIDSQINIRDHKNRALTDTVRGLALLNSGGAIALLGFVQAVWDNANAHSLVVGAIVGIMLLAVGALLAAVAGLLRYYSFYTKDTLTPWKNPSWRWMLVSCGLSAFAFFAGLMVTAFSALCSAA